MTMRRGFLIAGALCSLALAVAACGSSSSSSSSGSSGTSSGRYSSGGYDYGTSSNSSSGASASSNAVAIKETSDKYTYAPATLSVKAGNMVTWSNGSDAEHSVTFDGGGFSKDIKKGQAIRYTYVRAGTYAYHCEYHSYMHGIVRVTG